MIKSWHRLTLWFAVHIADIATTFVALSMGGYELNPVGTLLGTPAFMACKVGIVTATGVYVAKRKKWKLLTALTILTLCIVIWNLCNILPAVGRAS